MKNVQIIYDEFEKVYDMSKYPSNDKGLFGPLLRAQCVLIATQRRIIAASDQICKALETVVTTTPGSMEKLRAQELLMKDLVRLNERSRMLSQGSQEDYWSSELIKHLFQATSAESFPNYAMRTGWWVFSATSGYSAQQVVWCAHNSRTIVG